jgi:hypothetical protein
MRTFRKHLTYANVFSTIGVFLLLAGGTAIAAKQLGKKTVGAKQLKKNAVTTAKIKAKAVTKAKIADGAIDSTKLADGSVTTTKIADGAVNGADINGASTPFSQVVARLRNGNQIPFAPGSYTIGTYTQQTDEDNQYLAGIDVTFAASCSPPRVAVAKLLISPANPEAPLPQEIAGYGLIIDQTAGSLTKRLDFSVAPEGYAGLARVPPLSPTPRTFVVRMEASNCGGGGSGITVTNSLVDVIGTK